MLSNECFDVLIIGGGINGSVAAAALSSRGANVAIVDKGDFACLTSQNSSNLVWGGIKYMESFEFPLVRKLANHVITFCVHILPQLKKFVFILILIGDFVILQVSFILLRYSTGE